ncbi:cytochrome d ubiquinol oxidase subunit II [Clostridium saccharoperbutylacetonicum]|uniref:cytochrome d ubiquinol oxidase subunit II n=1 Tax=Clostridium saccharoperbutylacetonicum TaxID=36745 RepID=UPI000983E9EA|nr:cytochrome d ubiquinol oxidase subunit II [Clostridium saccharoperbutylacetonicum]AQR96299.1 cytochrome bd-I ubiquinol oxidase subunit 2 [Clostridium saccharoperbutylacetonicum]NSB32172.1 cytochrome d ubiquinol oxidase subunit II [Clostridium saccharoperbutylacetonicum]
MDLGIIWFILIGVLFTGFFFLEGFDFGVGILLLLIGKDDTERRIIINTIGPVWDGNEVWLITAGGAIFAAFPNWYATMFSGFYLALLVVLVALILRGVSFEFRSKNESQQWRDGWDKVIFTTSLLLAILFGVALSNFIKGVPIDQTMNYVGGFFDLISIYTLVAGITTLLVFTFHGAVFLALKADKPIAEKAEKIAKPIGIGAIIVSALLILLSFLQTDLFNSKLALVAAVIAFISLIVSWYLLGVGKAKIAMITNGLSIGLGVAALFAGLFPRVMVSSIKPEYNLTIANASSSMNTLTLMTKVAIIFVPIVLAYQIWTYWIFRKRVTAKDLEY